MGGIQEPQLAQIVDSHDFTAVAEEIFRIFLYHYSEEASLRVRLTYEQVRVLFAGEFPGYRACLVEYHDFRHTLDVVLATARLLDGCNVKTPFLPESLATRLLLAALFHDTGYVQEDWDTSGTGARYSREHEERSIAFLEKHAEIFEVDAAELSALTRFIRSTDLKRGFDAIPFSGEEERLAGAILGSADLMGQMADREYLEKLLFLYYEFREAGVPGYDTEFDILRKTHDFYTVIRKRLEETFHGVSALAQVHFRERYGTDVNLYLVAIERQMHYLETIIEDETTNFRAKLKRGDHGKLERYSQRPPG
jgi:hypothetical protein